MRSIVRRRPVLIKLVYCGRRRKGARDIGYCPTQHQLSYPKPDTYPAIHPYISLFNNLKPSHDVVVQNIHRLYSTGYIVSATGYMVSSTGYTGSETCTGTSTGYILAGSATGYTGSATGYTGTATGYALGGSAMGYALGYMGSDKSAYRISQSAC